jgi:hypothetical protein
MLLVILMAAVTADLEFIPGQHIYRFVVGVFDGLKF